MLKIQLKTMVRNCTMACAGGTSLLIALAVLSFSSYAGTGSAAGKDGGASSAGKDGGAAGKGGSASGSPSRKDDDDEDLTFFRADCRFHNIERFKGALFCYASSVYRPEDGKFDDVHLAVGCDNRTFFNQDVRIHQEMTLDRIQPHQAATPAIEIFPHGQLTHEGTYTSVLDFPLGRFLGLCYVHEVHFKRFEKPTGKPWKP